MKCPYCGSGATLRFYAAEMPAILAACPAARLAGVQKAPFEATICRKCALGFNSTPPTDAELKEIYDDYLYISPLAGIGPTRYAGMVNTLHDTYKTTDRLVEIGCSEGYLLSQLRNLGYTDLTGVEPAPQADTATTLGFRVIKEYFRRDMFEPGSVDGFYLMHVFEHLPIEFLQHMKSALSPSGAITMEVPHLEGFVPHHLYFYSMPFFRRLCRDYDLKIIWAEVNDLILRVVLVHRADPRPELTEDGEASKEETIALAQARHQHFVAEVERLKGIVRVHAGKTLYWWGAGSTGVVYLNQLEPLLIGTVQMVVVDGDRNKWGCYIPGPSLPVTSFEALRHRQVECLIIASGLVQEIRQNILDISLVAKRIEVFAA